MNSIHGVVTALTLALLIAAPAPSQQDAQTTSQAILLVQRAVAALAGSVAVNDVTLNVRVRRIAGSADETGSGVMKGLVTGESRIDITFPSGDHHEIRSSLSGKSEGRWTGPDGTPHRIAEHNLRVEGAWFFPALLLRRLAISHDKAFSYLGSEIIGNQTLEHIRVTDRNPAIPEKAPPTIAQLFQRLGKMDFYLDSATALPTKIKFNAHPDNDASKDIPVEIRFSDYRVVNGVRVPFHIQRLVNGSLVHEVDVLSADLNAGLSGSAFSLQ